MTPARFIRGTPLTLTFAGDAPRRLMMKVQRTIKLRHEERLRVAGDLVDVITPGALKRNRHILVEPIYDALRCRSNAVAFRTGHRKAPVFDFHELPSGVAASNHIETQNNVSTSTLVDEPDDVSRR